MKLGTAIGGTWRLRGELAIGRAIEAPVGRFNESAEGNDAVAGLGRTALPALWAKPLRKPATPLTGAANMPPTAFAAEAVGDPLARRTRARGA